MYCNFQIKFFTLQIYYDSQTNYFKYYKNLIISVINQFLKNFDNRFIIKNLIFID